MLYYIKDLQKSHLLIIFKEFYYIRFDNDFFEISVSKKDTSAVLGFIQIKEMSMFHVGQKVKILFRRSGLTTKALENCEVVELNTVTNRMLLKDKLMDLMIKDIEFTCDGKMVEPEIPVEYDEDISKHFKIRSCFVAEVIDANTRVKARNIQTVRQEVVDRYCFKVGQKVKVFLDRPKDQIGVIFENFEIEHVNMNSKNVQIKQEKKSFLHVFFWLDGQSKKNQDSTPVGFLVDESVHLEGKVLKNIYAEIKDQYDNYKQSRQKLAAERKDARDKKAAEKAKVTSPISGGASE